MSSLVKSTDGQLVYDTFQDDAAWTLAGAWALANYPTLTASERSSIVALSPTVGGADAGGVREGHLYVEDGVWYLYYGAGDGTGGTGGPWRVQLAVSTDKGLTWTKSGPTGIGLQKTDNPANGYWAARDMLWMGKYEGTYFMHMMSAASVVSNIPNPSYESDLFTSSSLYGPWTFVRRSVVKGGSGFDSRDAYTASMIYHAGEYYLFYSAVDAAASSNYQIGVAKATTPYGPYTKVSSAILPSGAAGKPENAKVFYHAHLGKWVMLLNEVNLGAGLTDKNRILLSDSISDWSAAAWYDIQRICPNDGATAIGIPSPFYKQNGIVVIDDDGSVPITFDANPTDSNHIGRKLYYAELIASPKAAYFNNGIGLSTSFSDDFNRANGSPGGNWTAPYGSGFAIVSNTLSAGTTSGDAILINSSVSLATFVASWDTTLGAFSGLGLVFRYVDQNNFYLIDITSGDSSTLSVILYKKVSGSYVQIGSSYTGAGEFVNNSTHSIKVDVAGTSFKFYLDNVLKITWADSTYSAAGYIGFRNGGSGSSSRVAENYLIQSAGAATEAAMTRSVTHADFVADTSFVYTTVSSSPFASFNYKTQASGDGYRVIITTGGSCRLQKVVSGTPTLLGSALGSLVTQANFIHRLRVVVTGTTHQVYLDGELQVNLTDSTYSSGVKVGFSAVGVDVRFAYLKMTKGPTVTINGLSNGQSLCVRGSGDIPLSSQTISGTSATYSAASQNIKAIDVNSKQLTTIGKIVGGDTLTTKLYTRAVSQHLVTAAGADQASLTGLKWYWFDQSPPSNLNTPTAQGTAGTTDAGGIFTVLVPSDLTVGRVGWLIITNSDGTTTQSPAHKAFSGPVAVS